MSAKEIMDQAQVEVKRSMDRYNLRTTNLEDIIIEFRRRGFQILAGRGIGLQGRVVFLPAPLVNERAEVTARNVSKSAGDKVRVAVSAERQVQHGVDTQGDETDQHGESSGLTVIESKEGLADRVQGGDGEIHRLQSSEIPSVAESA